MDSLTKEELVVDQFLVGMDNIEMNVQVAAHVHHRVENVLWVACSLEAVYEEENNHSHEHKPTKHKHVSCINALEHLVLSS